MDLGCVTLGDKYQILECPLISSTGTWTVELVLLVLSDNNKKMPETRH